MTTIHDGPAPGTTAGPGLPAARTTTTPLLADGDQVVLDSRPRLRRDVLFTRVPDGVLFHDATSGFRMHGRSAYRFAALLVPFLDGEHRVADLGAGLGEAQRSMVVTLVRSLYDRGYARSVPARDPDRYDALGPDLRRRFAPQIGYVDHHVDDAEERFLRFRQTSVAVLGDDETARWCALSLVRNGASTVGLLHRATGGGAPDCWDDVRTEAAELRADGCPVTLQPVKLQPLTLPTGDPTAALLTWEDLTGFDVVVVTPGQGAEEQVLRLLEAGVPPGRRLLPVWVLGDRAAVGPLMVAGGTGCWGCAALRLSANGDPGQAADFWSAATSRYLPLATRRPSDPVAGMLGNLVGYEIFRITTQALPAETDGKVILQDLDSLDVSVERLLPHPRCRHCSSVPDAAGDPLTGPVAAVAEPSRRYPSGQQPEPGTPEMDATLQLLEDRRRLLVQPGVGVFTGFADDPLVQTPLRVSAVDVALGHGTRRRVVAFDLHTVAAARLSALSAAAGLYADRVVPLAGVEPLPGSATARQVSPGDLGTVAGMVNEPEQVEAWVAATSLAGGGRVAVPAAAAEPFGPHNRRGIVVRSAAGLGVAGSPDRARGAGLLSALAYDALRDALRGTSRVSRVDPDRCADEPGLRFLLRSAVNLGVDVELLELGDPTAQPVPVLLARCAVPGADPSGSPLGWAVAADTAWTVAATTALRDLLGSVQLASRPEQAGPVDLGGVLLSDLDGRAVPVTGAAPARLEHETTFARALRTLRGTGRDAAVVSLGSADLRAGGLVAVRVLTYRTDVDAH